MRNGGDWFLALGKPNNGGTKIFSVYRPRREARQLRGASSACRSPKLLEMAGGMRGGKKLKAVIPGGSSMPVLPADVMMAPTWTTTRSPRPGSMLGSGAVIVMDETHVHGARARAPRRTSTSRSPAASARRAARARAGSTACVNRIEHGQGREEDLALLIDVADNIAGRTICALGDAAAWPVKSFIKHFRDEFVHHIEHKAACER